jgi:hypothetical protein
MGSEEFGDCGERGGLFGVGWMWIEFECGVHCLNWRWVLRASRMEATGWKSRRIAETCWVDRVRSQSTPPIVFHQAPSRLIEGMWVVTPCSAAGAARRSVGTTSPRMIETRRALVAGAACSSLDLHQDLHNRSCFGF